MGAKKYQSNNCLENCPVEKEAWIMSCRHVVCSKCIDKCDNGTIVCRLCDQERNFQTDFDAMLPVEVDIREIQLSLLGLRPAVLMVLATKALNFWFDQVC